MVEGTVEASVGRVRGWEGDEDEDEAGGYGGDGLLFTLIWFVVKEEILKFSDCVFFGFGSPS